MAKERQQGNHAAMAGNYKVPGMSRTFLCPPLCAGSMAAFAKNGQPLQQYHWSLMGIPTDGVIRAEEPLHSRAGDAAAGNTSYLVPECQEHSVLGTTPWHFGRALAADQLPRRDLAHLSLFRAGV